jgi:hypothetical protein
VLANIGRPGSKIMRTNILAIATFGAWERMPQILGGGQ